MKHTPKQIVRDSKYRQLIVESRGGVDGFREVRASEFSSAGEMVAASGTHVAYCTISHDIQCIPVKDTNKKELDGRVDLKGHTSGPVLDLAFSTHDYSLLASGGSDATAKVWNVATGEAKSSIEVKNARAITNVRWHPSCPSLLGTMGASMFNVFDITTGQSVATFDAKKDLSSVSWTWNGSAALLATPSDKSVRLCDPRTREAQYEIENAYTANKPITVEWMGASEHFFLSCGHSMNRDREACLWDIRQTKSAASRTRIDQNSGLLRALVDPDTNLIFFSGHGDSIVRVYEFGDDQLHPVISTTFTESAKSSCLLPKPACDVMGCEIDRVLRLLPSSIEGVRVEVPRRKAYRDFQEDLFPDTRALDAGLTVEQYTQNENANPVLQSVKALAAVFSTSETTQERAQQEETEDSSAREEEERLEREEMARLSAKNEELDKRFSKFLGYQAKMKFARATQSKRDDSVYNMAPDLGGSDSTNLAASNRFFACPWKGNAGPVYIGNISQPGKIPSPLEVPTLNGHASTVNCVQFDEFDDRVLATGSDDCSIRIWRLPESGIHSASDAQACLDASSKLEGGHNLAVRGINFHRLCANVLSSFGSDSGLKIWDVSSSQCLMEIGESDLGSAGVGGFDWSYDGSQFCVAGRDSIVRVCDPRQFKSKLVHSFTAHDGLKGSRVAFLGSEPVICSTGFGKTGDRQFRLWDLRMIAADKLKPLSDNPLDPGAGVILPHFVEDNGVLVLHAKGELLIRIFEIEGLGMTKLERQMKKFEVHRCNDFKCAGEPTAGLAFLPRRNVDYKNAEWLSALRLTPSMVERVSFTVPRSQEIQGYFYDDLYPPARSGEPVLTDPKAWIKGEAKCSGPNRIDLNVDKLKVLSQRPAAEANQSIKRGVASTDRMRKEQEEAERRRKEQQDALDRMQRLAVQHEKYNPNLSKPGMGGHDDKKDSAAKDDGPKEVNDEEWGD